MNPPTFQRNEVLTADKLNDLVAWVRSMQILAVGPGLELSRSPSGARLSLATHQRGVVTLYEGVIVSGPDPDTPAFPEDVEYEYQIRGEPGSITTGKPRMGRPAVGREARIFPSPPGSYCLIGRVADGDGVRKHWLWLPEGGENAPANPDGRALIGRGERLEFAACPPEEDPPPGGASDGADGVGAGSGSGSGLMPDAGGARSLMPAAERTMSSFYSSGEPGASLPGMRAPDGGASGGGGGGYAVSTRLPVKLGLIDTSQVGARERIEIQRATGGRLAVQVVSGTFASSLSVVYYTGPMGPLAFATPKTLTAAAPSVTFSAEDLNGVTAIEVVGPTTSPDGSGTRVQVGGAFELVVPSGMPGALALPSQVAG